MARTSSGRDWPTRSCGHKSASSTPRTPASIHRWRMYGTRPSSQRRTVLGSTSRRAATSSSLSRARSSARRKVSFKRGLQKARTSPTLAQDVPSRPSVRYRSSAVPASLDLDAIRDRRTPGSHTRDRTGAAAVTSMTGAAAQMPTLTDDLAVLRADFPAFKIWREHIPGRARYVVRSQRPGLNPHTVVTSDLAELREALEPARAAGMIPYTTAQPNIARMYTYWLRGKDHFPVDRAAADAVTEKFPEVAQIAQANRAFLMRAA